MLEEEWKPIEGQEGRHEISSLGNTRENSWVDKKGKVRPARVRVRDHSRAYPSVSLGGPEGSYVARIHRLAAEAFVPYPDDVAPEHRHLLVVHHKDGNPANNVASNLKWCTASHNIQYAMEDKEARRPSPYSKPVHKCLMVVADPTFMHSLRMEAINLGETVKGYVLRVLREQLARDKKTRVEKERKEMEL